MQDRVLRRTVGLFGIDIDLVDVTCGYVDVLDSEPPRPTGFAQRLMNTTAVPRVYERWWRPALGRVAKGLRGPSMAEEVQIARDLLRLAHGDAVVDVACGPGNFTRAFGDDVGASGLAVGVDVSVTMLRRAVSDTQAEQVAYVRADITAGPALRPGSVEAVCCFAALHLFNDPESALDVMASALVPGGRLAILTSARPQPAVARAGASVLARLTGMAMFDSAALAHGLASRGLVVTHQETFGVAQVIGARAA